MNQQLREYLDGEATAVDEDVRQAIELCGGDAVSALRITLIANAFLQEENERLKKQTSQGYTRKGHAREGATRKDATRKDDTREK